MGVTVGEQRRAIRNACVDNAYYKPTQMGAGELLAGKLYAVVANEDPGMISAVLVGDKILAPHRDLVAKLDEVELGATVEITCLDRPEHGRGRITYAVEVVR